MKIKNESAESEELKQQIDEIKAKLKKELEELIREQENKIAELKKEYRRKEQEQTKELKKQRVNALAHNFYNNNYRRADKQPTLQDQYATEIFGKSYKECNVLEQKVVNNKYRREYRRKIKEENKSRDVRN